MGNGIPFLSCRGDPTKNDNTKVRLVGNGWHTVLESTGSQEKTPLRAQRLKNFQDLEIFSVATPAEPRGE